MAKLTFRIWLLSILLAVSIIWIFNLSSFIRLLIFSLLFLIPFSINKFKSKKIIFLISAMVLVLTYFLIISQSQTGVIIKTVEINSTAYEQGLRTGQIIKEINGNPIKNLDSFNQVLENEFSNISDEKKITIKTTENQYIFLIDSAPKIIVSEIPFMNIKLGLDLQGGSRALVKPEEDLSLSEIESLIDVTSNRLNIYGLSDIVIRSVSDLDGNNYMLIEIAGASPEELEDLISKQGKFEAKIGNQTVFVGGEDISHVERMGVNAGIEACFESESGELCRFRFPITLTDEAAKRHAEITNEIPLNSSNPQYLSETLDLYVDEVLMDSLFISRDLKGRETTQISIQGSGQGSDRQSAIKDAESSMKQLQTILITGSLPYKLEIVKLDSISPVLGKRFINTIIIAGLSAILTVSIIILFRYKSFKLSLALLFTSFSEIIIILGFAAAIGWNLDLSSMAGIIATIGTGVDQQIVLLDESRSSKNLSLKERLKRALFIIFGSFATTVFAMIPLLFAGAGLLKGFAITTLLGITVGVFVSRPAFADIIKKILE